MTGLSMTKKRKKMLNRKVLKIAFKDTIPVLSGYMVLGIGFGILLRSKGFGVGWAFAMSAGIYAGAMQFVAIDLLSSGASLMTAALTTLLVNARHLFYGISMIERYRNVGKVKPYLIFGLTDETYSLVCREALPEGIAPRDYYFAVTLLDHIYWTGGSVLGSLIGGLIRFDTTGIDFSLTALFITVVIDQWRAAKDHSYALIGFGITALSLWIFGKETFLIPAMAGILLCLFIRYRKDGKQEGQHE